MNVLVNKVSLAEDIQKCLDIRTTVFVIGQNVPQSEEVDGKDQDSDHYLLTIDGMPVGVARVRYTEDFAKIERVAILNDYQGQGFGVQIMRKMLSDIRQSAAIASVKLSSQTYAIPFYEKLGFSVCSEEYMDANIPHRDMALNLNQVLNTEIK